MVNASPKPVSTPLLEGPSAPPIIQLFNWLTRPYPFLDDCAQRYGEIFLLRLSQTLPLVFFSNPEAIQIVFKADPNCFLVGNSNCILRPLVGDQSLLLLDGDRHQRQRQLLMPPFHGERMRAYGGLMQDITRQVTAPWAIAQPFSVRPFMQEISLRIILQAVFGIHQGKQYEQLRQLTSRLLDMTGSPLSSSLLFLDTLQRDWGAWSPWGQFVRLRAQVDELLYQEIHDRRDSFDPSREDILTLLLSARDEDGQPMTDDELRDELMTLLLAGHETTASALTWALYWIHQHPDVEDRLRAELKTIEPGDGLAIMRSPYLNAVCQETLRIYPIAPITFVRRVVNQPFELMGRVFPPDTLLAPCIYLTHHRPDLYPDSKQFQPQRFLDRQFSPYEFLPFGGSNRRCLGMAFAMYELKLVLATILSQFHLMLEGDRPLHPVRRGVTLAPPSSFKMVAVNRQ
jgi:cytochrome P450